MKLDEIYAPVKQDLQRVEERLETIVTSRIYPVFESYDHILSSGGKRLRPALVLLSAKCLNSNSSMVVDTACAVELIHIASLIHDDIIDSADLRRDKPAVHVVWGTEAAVAVGDYLFSQAMEILAEHGNSAVIKILAKTVKRMAEGELLETFNRRNTELTEEEYIEIVSGKTASLMSTSCEIVANIASAVDPYYKALSQYGLNFGISYQVMDDLLDLVSTDGELGKPTLNNLREGNLPLPVIHTLRNGNGGFDKKELLSILSNEEISNIELQKVVDMVGNSGALSYTRAVAEGYAENAKEALTILEDSVAKRCLSSLADFIMNRHEAGDSWQLAGVNIE
ncbi:polyprenyl synthetase family protein [Candidatus Poribacteria bacterium]